jgi:protocatechuate 3,4-dioxygenase beta subunit
MERMKFITTMALSAVAVSSFGKAVQKEENKFEGDCKTTSDILGPFYRPNAPIRNNLNYQGLKGAVLNIAGVAFGKDCVIPLKNVEVEIWHCDTEGEYDNTSDKFRHRARVFTNSKGEYRFKTIFPGKYLNGSAYRPAHIHFRVSSKETKELVSQVYFQNDPDIIHDQWASNSKAKHRTLTLTPKGHAGELAVEFNIYMQEK